MQNNIALKLLLILPLTFFPASGDPLFGVYAEGATNYSIPGPTSFAQSFSTQVYLPQAIYVMPPFYGGQDSITFVTDRPDTGIYTSSAGAYLYSLSNDHQLLHASGEAFASNAAPGVGASALTHGYISWLDTIRFTGAPSGTPVDVELIKSLEGSISITGNSVDAGIFDIATFGSIDLRSAYSTSQPIIHDTQVGYLTTAVGDSLSLNNQLGIELEGTGNFSFKDSFDLQDTGAVYLKVLTPGINLESASGADYSMPSSATVPEPSYLFFTGSCLAGLALVKTKNRLRVKRKSVLS
jgi:hypothetical protein